jgi:hypothetical protein
MQTQSAREHPDTDLLTAFAEQTLAGNERERVLLHLATCGTCREIVSLALPEQAEAVEEVAPIASAWFRWPVLRWTALAATVIVVGAAVSVLVRSNRGTEVSVPAHEATSAAKESQSRAVSPESVPKHAHTEKLTPQDDFKQRSEPTTFARRQKLQAAPPALGSRDAEFARKAAPTAQIKTLETEVAESKLKSLPAEGTKKETVPKDAETADAVSKNAAVGGAIGKIDGALVADKAAPAPPPVAAQNEAVSALRQLPSGTAGPQSASTMELAKGPRSYDLAATRWHVSSSGAVERSPDGKTWEKVEIDAGVSFRAISSNGGDLWAGGTSGALFHSADAGRTWSRVKVGYEGMWASDAIIAVNFASPRNGFVSTASGAVWTTEDGGRTWQRRQ